MASFMDYLRVIGNAFQYVQNAPFTGRDPNKTEVENLKNFIDSKDKPSNVEQAAEILGEVQSSARQEYLEDRYHTEAREDSAYQRAVVDMRKAGLNPYTISSSGAASSTSQVGENSIYSKLQVLGYLLDLENLSVKNKQVANAAIGNFIRAVK